MRNPFQDDIELDLCIQNIEPDSWGCFTEGYYWAAKILLDEVLQSQKYQNRWVAYAIMFNIRHFYELSLKDILIQLGKIDNRQYFRPNHPLDALIDKVVETTKQYLDISDINGRQTRLLGNFESIIRIIRQEMNVFIDYDNNSFAFRYPYRINGSYTVKDTLCFNAKRIKRSLQACRKELAKISTEVLCDNRNPMFNEQKK